MDEIEVAGRVCARHPDISESEVREAWRGTIRSTRRLNDADPSQYLAVGFTAEGRLLEMIATLRSDGRWRVYHANDAQSKALKELGLI